MANNYVQLAFELAWPSGAIDYTMRLADAWDAYAVEGTADQFPEAIIKTVDELGAFTDGCLGCNFGIDVTTGTLVVTSDESAVIPNLVTLLQHVMTTFEIGQPVSFAWALTCSQPRIGEFGGGAIVFTKDQIWSVDADDWLAATLTRLLTQPAPA